MINSSGTPLVSNGGSPVFTPFIERVVASLLKQDTAFSLHGQDPHEWGKAQELIEKVSNARVILMPADEKLPETRTPVDRTARNLPTGIPSGQQGYDFAWALAGFDANEPMRQDHYIRHTLPGTYTFTATGMTLGTPTTVDVNGTSYTQIPVTNIQSQVVSFSLRGPVGNFPADWDIQFLRQSDVAAYDNTEHPIYHPTRYFIPEFIAQMTEWKGYWHRWMKSLRTEMGIYTTTAEFPTSSWRIIRGMIPLDVTVAMSNHLQTGAWINFPPGATDGLIDDWCDYLIANLDPKLPLGVGHGNEHWNFGYRSCQSYYGGRGTVEYGTQGAGTISFDKATRVITRGAGAPDFTTVFGSAADRSSHITFGGKAYGIQYSSITADSMSVWAYWDDWLMEDATDVDYHYSGSQYYFMDRGYLILSTLAMKRVTDKFTAAGQMYRLTRMFEAQLANLGSQNAWKNSAAQWGSAPEYIDPSTVHDGFAINPYFGSGFGNQSDFATAIEAAVTADDQSTFNTMITNYFLEIPITDVATSPRSLYQFFGHRLKRWAEFALAEGKELHGYEGGHHIVHSQVWSSGFTDMFRAFLYSSEAQTLYEAWRDVQIAFLNGPVMKFQMNIESSTFGAYGLEEGYTIDETNNKEQAVCRTIQNMVPFWLPENPPVIRMIPDQVWTVGVQPISPYKASWEDGDPFSFWDFSSKNTTSWSGTLPGGTTYNASTGQVNAPVSAASETEVTITAHNASGSDQITFNVTVVDP